MTPGESIVATVTDLQPTIGNGSRAVSAIVDLESPGQLRPGATLTCRLLVETRENAVLVPANSIVRRPAGEVVYIIKGDEVEARLVETGEHAGDLIEVVSGLQGNEPLATVGAAFLTDGAAVTIKGE